MGTSVTLETIGVVGGPCNARPAIKASLDLIQAIQWTSHADGASSGAVKLAEQGKDDIHEIHEYQQLANPPVLYV